MKREFSSGGVVFKRVKERESIRVKVLFLITKSSPSNLYPIAYWRLPKGWLDDEKDKPGLFTLGTKKADENILQEAALREVGEEAGVDVKIIKKVGTYKFFFYKSGEKYLKFVTYYLMEWINDLPEGFGFETSEVGWFTFEEAREKLKHKSEKEVLEKADKILSSGLRDNLL
jgi:8-oxo-dGTP pyrophosphatase MutT (NUDIX family)